MEESIVALQLAYHVRRVRLGRRRLAELTGLTEMAVRIELERLRGRDLVSLPRSGVELTAAGTRRFEPILEPIRAIARVELTSLRLATVTLAAHVGARAVPPVWTLRDGAIREGATGFLLLRFHPDGWTFGHNSEPIARRNPRDAATIESTFPEPRDGDLLLIASGPDLRRAGLGLWQVASIVLAILP